MEVEVVVTLSEKPQTEVPVVVQAFLPHSSNVRKAVYVCKP